MSHHHVLHLPEDVDVATLADAIGRLVGLDDGSRQSGLVFARPWADDPGWVTIVAAAPAGAQLRNRDDRFEVTYMHGDDPWAGVDGEPPSGRPLVQVWGIDPFAFAVLAALGQVFGGDLVVNDDWRADVRLPVAVARPELTVDARIGALEPVTHRQLKDAARTISEAYGPGPHRVPVPALARQRVPAYAS